MAEDGDMSPARVAAPVPSKVDLSTAQEAAAATDAEHNMGSVKSFRLYWKACLWSIFISTCIIMDGFDTALLRSLFAYPAFQRQFGVQQANGTYQLTAAWQSGLTNGVLCGSIIGLFLNGILADRFGYRKTLIGALVGITGFIFIIFFSKTLPQLLVGEILAGIPWGIFQTLTTTYASEVCPTHLRAYLTTYNNLCWVIGQFIASGVLRAMVSRTDDWGYKIPFALQWMWPVPLAIGIYLAPESPWWLVRRGKVDEARRSLARLTSRSTAGTEFNIDETISMMIHTNEMERELTAGTTYWDLFKGVNARRTEIVCMVWMGQTLSGSNFMGYSTYFYQQAGLAVGSSFSMSLGQYGIGIVGTILSWFLMTWFGRRTLFFTGQVCACFILFTIGCASFAGSANAGAQWGIGSLLLVYTFVYDSSVGPICYSLVAELTSTRLRAKSVVLARNMYNIASIIANILTPRMLNPTAWGWGAKTGFFWAGTALCCATWTFFRLPEPKGRTYGELDTLFEQGVSARKFATTAVGRIDVGFESVSITKDGGSTAEIERIATKT
ncbi:maltose permease [Trichoderma parareesei]|uniref:Maltose permease n=1 Tax=Trichoderma parareesei TaxID=858221 RepID=A0A2H2ZIS4_TRIPA|nr:maltose permease [Trichoderma parareesei]